jgi:hypothetical protein
VDEIMIAEEYSKSEQILSNSKIDELNRKDLGQLEAMDINQNF